MAGPFKTIAFAYYKIQSFVFNPAFVGIYPFLASKKWRRTLSAGAVLISYFYASTMLLLLCAIELGKSFELRK